MDPVRRRTSWVPIIFLALVTFGTFEAFKWYMPDIKMAARVFYISRGIEGVCLFLLLAHFADRSLSTLQRTVLTLTVIYGSMEEALTAVCGGSVYLVHGGIRTGDLLCDGPHGTSPLLTLVAILLILLVRIIYERVSRSRDRGRDA